MISKNLLEKESGILAQKQDISPLKEHSTPFNQKRFMLEGKISYNLLKKFLTLIGKKKFSKIKQLLIIVRKAIFLYLSEKLLYLRAKPKRLLLDVFKDYGSATFYINKT